MGAVEVEVRSEGNAGAYAVQVVASPVGEAGETVLLDVEALLACRDRLQQALLASSVRTRRLLEQDEGVVREVGQALFMALLGHGTIAGRYQAAAALADERGEGLRVVLRLKDPQLAGLPWEAMYDPSEGLGGYLCQREQLVRRVPVARAPAPLAVRPPLRVLGIASSPRGLPQLDVEKEQDQFFAAVEPLVAAGRVQVHWAEQTTWRSLQDLLADRSRSWHVVHFIGHGDFDSRRDTGVLALVGQDGRAHFVDAEQFVVLLRTARPMPRLVVLNSCSGGRSGQADLFSGTGAALVRGGVTAVAAMQFEISDEAAIAFCDGFYGAVAHGWGIDDAVSHGRRAILGLSNHTLEWITPVLYLRGDQTHLFALTADDEQIPMDRDAASGADGEAPHGEAAAHRPVMSCNAGAVAGHSDPAAAGRQHVFISYVREDADRVTRLRQYLHDAGLRVWTDTEDLWPGQDWRSEIRRAIRSGSLVFLACFSSNSVNRASTYQNEELLVAIEQMRLQSPGSPWLIPVRFNHCALPEYDLGAGRTLDSLQRVDLFDDTWQENAARLATSLQRGAPGVQDPRSTADTQAPAGTTATVEPGAPEQPGDASSPPTGSPTDHSGTSVKPVSQPNTDPGPAPAQQSTPPQADQPRPAHPDPLAVFELAHILTWRRGPLRWVLPDSSTPAFSPDGHLLASATLRTVRVWDRTPGSS